MHNLFLWIGSMGVALLLLAFILNIMGKWSENGAAYLLFNFFGALMAALYAWQGGSVPFVILEMTWAMAAMVRLVRRKEKAPTDQVEA